MAKVLADLIILDTINCQTPVKSGKRSYTKSDNIRQHSRTASPNKSVGTLERCEEKHRQQIAYEKIAEHVRIAGVNSETFNTKSSVKRTLFPK